MAILSEAAHISPYALGTIALKTAARGEFSQALRPVYLKMPLAVEKLEEQLKEQLKDEGR
ncbi:MAG: hypothetical protein HQK97_10275 [Nitrospirae bacterium]|nr:hypothetical protein [Nitrospirota bacterium]